MASLGPTTKRHRSKQDYRTPPELVAAVEARFGPLGWDMACSLENSVVGRRAGSVSITAADDSLGFPWVGVLDLRGAWCNPPFNDMGPWAAQCESVRHRLGWTLLLGPASVDACWYRDHVHHKAMVLPLRGRVTFLGETHSYPKPLMIAAYGFGVHGFEPWDWKAQ